MKIYLLKAKHFIKRNIYPITVTLCTALMIGIIAISAYTSIKSSSDEMTIISTQKPVTGDQTNNGNEENNDNNNQEESKEPSKETTSTETIIFDLPFQNATISKEYAEDKLLYDETTKFWCTHQAIDFSCSEGQKICAVYDGVITKIENSMMNGTVVYIKIADNLVVVYKGLSSIILVKEGDSVKNGQEIGTATSMLSEKADGIHLHLELMKDEKYIDPTDYFSFNK